MRSRRLEVVGERENGRAQGRHARGEGASSLLASLLLVHPFFLVPTTFKRVLRRLYFISQDQTKGNNNYLYIHDKKKE